MFSNRKYHESMFLKAVYSSYRFNYLVLAEPDFYGLMLFLKLKLTSLNYEVLDQHRYQISLINDMTIFLNYFNSQSENSNDLDDMSKKEVSSDNKEKKQHIVKYDTKFLRLHNRLEKLKRDYQDSKEHSFVQRYNLMKDMIKTVIKDDCLKPD
ncbi:hypothetical protein KUTeg_004500 [Tegillarca granosa]|uniref:Uncharacterized protein n=1 Tax=Tegillarca granosa TaxID=220873 RepID=A0ABQ9FQ40_TEGGR|nr:hypothetical protein KUTeg_004500 [Tegillarca granosa]